MLGLNDSGQPISLDPSKLIGTHMAVIGNTGSGKTHTIRKALEDLWGEAIIVVLDPEQEFHTLRQGHPYVIAGGPHADVPRGHPAALAETILKTGQSTIIQYADDEDLEAQRHFVALFIDGLMMQPRALWRPLILVIDEAHRYAPQGEGACSLRPICTLMSQGRKRGFTGVLATQRLAKISKNAVGECNTWLVGRVGQVLDRNAAANNLGFPLKSDEAIGLRTLNPGQFWGFGVAIGPVPTLIGISATKTQHLKLGERFTPAPLARKPVAAAGREPKPKQQGGGFDLGLTFAIGLVALVCVLPRLFS